MKAARTAAIAAIVYGAGLAYLSLARGGDWACGAVPLADFSPLSKVSRADLVVNVVAYVPFGATVAGAGLSIAWLSLLEVAQLWVPGRTADTSTPLLALTGWAIALAVQSRATDPVPTRRSRPAP